MRPSPALLDISISVDYPSAPNTLRNIALSIEAGETLGLVGVSGSGKSTLALALLKLLSFSGAKVRGRVLWRGRNLNSLPEKALRAIRGKEIAYMPQSPIDALNPILRVETQLWEAWRAHSSAGRERWERRVRELATSVGLPDDRSFFRRRPRQLSVGQAQRVLIAMALLHAPALLVADEPTSALDVISRADTLRLLRSLSAETGMALLFISHDLAAAAEICDRVAVIQAGEIVEVAPVDTLFDRPRSSYTRRLIEASPGSFPIRRMENTEPVEILSQ